MSFQATGTVSVILKATYYSVSLIAIPIQVSNIGLDKFGFLSLILSVNILVPLVELGTGLPLLNILTDKVLRSNTESLDFLGRIIRLYLVISLILLLFYISLLSFNYLGGSSYGILLSNEVLIILLVVTLSLILSLYGNLAARYLMAVGESLRATIAQNLGQILAVSLTSTLTFVTDSIVFLILPTLLLPNLTIFIFFFSSKKRMSHIKKIKNLVKSSSIKEDSDGLFKQSRTYVTLNLGNLLSLQFGGVIIALSLTPADLGRYYVAWKYLTLFSTLISTLYSSQWSDYRRTFRASFTDYKKRVTSQHQKSIILGILIFVPIQLVSPKALEIWTNGKLQIDLKISTILASYVVIFAISYPINMFFNIAYSKSVLLTTGLLTNFMNFLFTVILLNLTESYSSPILGSLMAIALFSYIPQFCVFKLNRKISR